MTAKKNILIALMLLLLVAASACALTACNGAPTDIGAQIATDDVGNPMYGGENYVMPEGMAFSASASTAADTDTSVTLTALYEPAGTTNQQTNWSVSFANPASAWATGKTVTDYVTVTSTGVNTAEVTCLQAFGEQIIITATSVDNSSVSDTTTVDFEKKLSDVKFTLYYDSTPMASIYQSEMIAGTVDSSYFEVEKTISEYIIKTKIDLTDEEKQYSVKATPVYSDYTIDVSMTFFGDAAIPTLPDISKGETFEWTTDSYYTYSYPFDAESQNCFDMVKTFMESESGTERDAAFFVYVFALFEPWNQGNVQFSPETVDEFTANAALVYCIQDLVDTYNEQKSAGAYDTDVVWSNAKESYDNLLDVLDELGVAYRYNTREIEGVSDIAELRNYFSSHQPPQSDEGTLYIAKVNEDGEMSDITSELFNLVFYINPESVV